MKKIFYLFIALGLIWACKNDDDSSLGLPQLVTIDISEITDTNAVSGGEIKNSGNSEIIEKGVCWSEKEMPTIKDSHTKEGKGIEKYISNLSDLKPEITYYVRAYATNANGTAYGNQIKFSTSKKRKPLEIEKDKLELKEGDSFELKIISGNGNYEVKSNDDNIATPEIKDETIIILAKAIGETKVTITDTLTQQTKEISITISSAGTATISDIEHYIPSIMVKNTLIGGKIENGKLEIIIPYTNGEGRFNNLEVKAQTTIGQNGDVNQLTLHIPTTELNNSGELKATINVDGDGEYLIKEMQAGKTYDIAEFNIKANSSEFKVKLKGIGGVVDKMFGRKTNNEFEHQFIYIPIIAADGKIWLNNNLGAEYSNMSSEYYAPTKQAEYENDHLAYGSLFQWQRKPDGHELINWEDGYEGSAKHNLGWFDELHKFDSDKLWQQGGANNPCPNGFHVPTKEEAEKLLTALGSDDARVIYDQTLKFTLTGNRNIKGEFRDVGDLGEAWTSTKYKDKDNKGHMSYELNFDSLHSEVYGTYKNTADPVRCIKDK